MIEGPGIYFDIPEEAYHTDGLLAPALRPSLSASDAKALLADPATFAYRKGNPKAASRSMDAGSVAHAIVLGTGSEIVRVDAPNWLTKAAQTAKKEAVARGAIAVNNTEWAKAEEIAQAVLTHPTAGPMFTEGNPEVSFYWHDLEGTLHRARLDYYRPDRIVDLKTTADASPDGFARSCAKFGYRESAAHYREAVTMLTGGVLPFTLVAVETAPPYPVRLYEFGAGDLEYGARRMREAAEAFRKYEAEGYPPMVDPEIHELVMPAWAIGDIPVGVTDVEALEPEERF